METYEIIERQNLFDAHCQEIRNKAINKFGKIAVDECDDVLKNLSSISKAGFVDGCMFTIEKIENLPELATELAKVYSCLKQEQRDEETIEKIRKIALEMCSICKELSDIVYYFKKENENYE